MNGNDRNENIKKTAEIAIDFSDSLLDPFYSSAFGFADSRHTNVHILIRVWYSKEEEEKKKNGKRDHTSSK